MKFRDNWPLDIIMSMWAAINRPKAILNKTNELLFMGLNS